MSETALNEVKEKVILKIDGLAFEGWTSVRVSRSIDTLCSSFSLDLVERVPGQVDRSAIRDQAACELWLGDELFLTGWVFEIQSSRDDRQHSISISGRDKTADLVDCSADHTPGTWKNQKMDAIARQLLAPFGLKLIVKADVGAPFATFALEQAESVFEAITRMGRMRGLMVKTDAAGDVILFTPAPIRTGVVFELGRNITSIGLHSSSADRFSTYTLKGQHHGGSFVEAKDAAGPKGTATDGGITRYRPLIVVSDEQATPSGLETRALWEATTRLGRSLEASVTTKGWRDDQGALFAPEIYARLLAEPDGLDAELMITAVEFSLGDRGTTAAISLARPEAFTTEALLEAKKKKGRKGRKDTTAALVAALESD